MALRFPTRACQLLNGVPVRGACLKKNGLFRKRNEVKGPWSSSLSIFLEAQALPGSQTPRLPSLKLRPLQLHLQSALRTPAQALKPLPCHLQPGLTGGQMGSQSTRPGANQQPAAQEVARRGQRFGLWSNLKPRIGDRAGKREADT